MDTTLISQAEAARRLRVSRQEIARLIKKKRLQTHEVAGRRLLTIGEILQYQRERLPPGWAGYNRKRAKLKEISDKQKERHSHA